ncbi:uncharacterized protein CTRU02_201942 [Colletotrichum truncatum]|uniref:Uncharacterized protein n=1 Tax=Colletotrichum truncatum TaxID=5467 RepID=A0ACC3ZJ16_COLTU|nr:uncharacterized protein CTRU02_07057 [Colletotrichum truncatum]KAF6791873.1 hypothetical protein CTRU02_07057 [Colletotrichum truncatum]
MFRLAYIRRKVSRLSSGTRHLTMSKYSGHDRVSLEFACLSENQPVVTFGGSGRCLPLLPGKDCDVREGFFSSQLGSSKPVIRAVRRLAARQGPLCGGLCRHYPS